MKFEVYMTYYNQIEELVAQYPDFWDYYGIHRNSRIDQIFNNPLRFIEETFMYASKKLLAPTSNGEDDELRPKLSEARAAHSVSTFFLGAFIAKRLFDGVFSAISTERNSSNGYEFSYIWTLTCLYHDCGYTLEKDQTLAQQLAKAVNSSWARDTIEQQAAKHPYQLGMTQFRKSMELRRSIWCSQGSNSYCRSKQMHKNLIDQYDCVECRAILNIEDYYRHATKTLYSIGSATPIYFPIRKSSEINRYFAYRLLTFDTPVSKTGCIDHGIAGGYLFFDRIIRNYAKAYMSALRYDADTNISNFINPNDYNEQPMHFSFDQLPLFAYISDCIMNHNIWSAKSNTANAQIYQKLSMNKLLVPKYDRVNFFRNPLLFILAVSDSIEPYKLFSAIQIDKAPYNKDQLQLLLKETNIEIINDRIVIKPPKTMIDKFHDKINELKDWVDVDCRENADTFEIIPCPAD